MNEKVGGPQTAHPPFPMAVLFPLRPGGGPGGKGTVNPKKGGMLLCLNTFWK